MREQARQSKIKRHLEKDGWVVVNLIKTSMNGIPDLMALKDGVTRFIEVKQPSGKLSEIQRYRLKQLRRAGFDALVLTDIDTSFDED